MELARVVRPVRWGARRSAALSVVAGRTAGLRSLQVSSLLAIRSKATFEVAGEVEAEEAEVVLQERDGGLSQLAGD